MSIRPATSCTTDADSRRVTVFQCRSMNTNATTDCSTHHRHDHDQERAGIEAGRHPALERVAGPAIGLRRRGPRRGADQGQAGVERAHGNDLLRTNLLRAKFLKVMRPGDSRRRAPPAGIAGSPGRFSILRRRRLICTSTARSLAEPSPPVNSRRAARFRPASDRQNPQHVALAVGEVDDLLALAQFAALEVIDVGAERDLIPASPPAAARFA